MSWEAAWYASHVDGKPPKQRRLCRLPIADQWRAAIDIAICFARGEAGFRTGKNSTTGEVYWYWPAEGYAQRSATSVKSDWWVIPYRVQQRVFALHEAAITATMRRGACCNLDVAVTLKKWKRTGHWRQIAAGVFPRHGEPTKLSKKELRRLERAKSIAERAHEKRWSVTVMRDDCYTVRSRPSTADAVRSAWDRIDYDGSLREREIDRLIAAGGLVEERACTT